jgi:hypothetical protein
LRRPAAIAMSALGAALLLSGFQGCGPRGNEGAAAPLPSFGALKPDGSPGEEAVLLLGGVKIPVTVRREERDGMVVLALEAHGEVIEEERYAVSPEGFHLVDAAGETYDPHMPLLRSPMKTKDSWTWEGTMTAGQTWPATAEISTSQDTLYVGERAMPTVKVEVLLQFDGGGPSPAQRTLSFWFAEDQGVIKREFGSHSARVPPEP